MDQAARGKKALTDGNYQEAIEAYTAALKSAPTSPDYFIQRSTAHQRAKDYAAALKDANNAVIQAHKRAKREFIIEAQFRRGCALHSLERYGDAEFVFEIVKRMDEKHKMVATWIGRNKMSMDKLDAEDERRQCHVKEMPGAEDVAALESKPAGTNGSSDSAKVAPSTAPAASQQTPAEKIRHDWYQNAEHVYFTLLAKGVPKDKAQIDIQERSLSISFPLATGASFDFTLDPLFAAVIPEKCEPRVLGTKIEIALAKAVPNQKWGALESKDPATKSQPSNKSDDVKDLVKAAVLGDSKPAGPSYPTSSKSGPKDWDKIVKDARKEGGTKKGSLEGDDDDDEGGDPANDFFKKLFKDSSPEVQRAMMKSYTESNGTALSTDWGEVSKAKVETVPPDGMEAKTWEK